MGEKDATSRFVRGDALKNVRCEVSAVGLRTLIFDDGATQVALDEGAIVAGSDALKRAIVKAASVRTGASIELLEEMQATVETAFKEHAKTCPSCGPVFARRPQA